MHKVIFRRNTQTAILPKRGRPEATGLNLSADLGYGETMTLYPGKRKLIPTGLSAAVTVGWYMRIEPLDGLAFKYGIGVLSGGIDSGNRGDIGVVLINHSDQPFVIKHGDNIAQAIFERCATPEVEEAANLPESVRGGAGNES